ncbi:hypothetical protein FXO37_20991 [Capsicum annuum]|nr:hypothetical protein FXO37_20991 [Capsicum annuum]
MVLVVLVVVVVVVVVIVAALVLFVVAVGGIDLGVSSGGVAGGVDVGGRHADTTPSRDIEHDSQDNLFVKVEAITKAVEKLKSKRGVIPSKKVREPYTPTTAVRRKKIAISQVHSNQKSKKITTPPFSKNPKAVKVQGPFKKVDIYAELGTKEKRDLRRYKQGAKDYPIHTFFAEDFKSMTDICMQYLDKDEEIIKYVRRERLNPQGKSWTKAKGILGVMNIDDIRYQDFEILLEEGKIKVYDCNLSALDEVDFFTSMQPLLELFPILLRPSKLMDHFPMKVLIKQP